VVSFHTEQPPASGQPNTRFQNAAAFWAWYEEVKAAGETLTGGVLDGLLAEYLDILSREPLDIGRVESLTAEALLTVCGKKLC
jgi:hypothetical protein